MSSLKKLFDASGTGNAFEVMAHKLASSELHCCLREDGSVDQLSLGGRTKVLVRTTANLQLPTSECPPTSRDRFGHDRRRHTEVSADNWCY